MNSFKINADLKNIIFSYLTITEKQVKKNFFNVMRDLKNNYTCIMAEEFKSNRTPSLFINHFFKGWGTTARIGESGYIKKYIHSDFGGQYEDCGENRKYSDCEDYDSDSDSDSDSDDEPPPLLILTQEENESESDSDSDSDSE